MAVSKWNREGNQVVARDEVSLGLLIDLVPDLSRFRKGSCLLIERRQDCYFLVKNTDVYFLKRRCLSCFHLRFKGGCGIGPDCKPVCLVPSDGNFGWSNIITNGAPLSKMVLLVLGKIFTLLQEKLPGFLLEQIEPLISRSGRPCPKYINAKPMFYRLLEQLDAQEHEVLDRLVENAISREQAATFLDALRAEKEEVLDRLSLFM